VESRKKEGKETLRDERNAQGTYYLKAQRQLSDE
jgi:hypothetical protein